MNMLELSLTTKRIEKARSAVNRAIHAIQTIRLNDQGVYLLRKHWSYTNPEDPFDALNRAHLCLVAALREAEKMEGKGL